MADPVLQPTKLGPQPARAPAPKNLRASVVGAVIWLAGCIVGGFAVLHRLGEYGSVLHLLIGVAMGITGALSHVLLSAIAGFRRLGFVRRGLLNWLCAYSALVVVGAMVSYPKASALSPAEWLALAKQVFLPIGAAMVVLAMLVAIVTSKAKRKKQDW